MTGISFGGQKTGRNNKVVILTAWAYGRVLQKLRQPVKFYSTLAHRLLSENIYTFFWGRLGEESGFRWLLEIFLHLL